MEPFTVDYGQTSPFKGIRILFHNMEEGLNYAQQHKIKDICIWSCTDNTKQIVNFEFLKEFTFIETFHWLVPLSKKSDINGIYYLDKLKNFRWSSQNNSKINFSKLVSIESMNIPFHNLINISHLKNLEKLYVNSVESENLEFLSKLNNLKLLRVINGKIISLEGLDNCKNLQELDLRRCFKLINAQSTLNKLENIKSVVLDSCKKHDIDVEKLKLKVKHVWINGL